MRFVLYTSSIPISNLFQDLLKSKSEVREGNWLLELPFSILLISKSAKFGGFACGQTLQTDVLDAD